MTRPPFATEMPDEIAAVLAALREDQYAFSLDDDPPWDVYHTDERTIALRILPPSGAVEVYAWRTLRLSPDAVRERLSRILRVEH